MAVKVLLALVPLYRIPLLIPVDKVLLVVAVVAFVVLDKVLLAAAFVVLDKVLVKGVDEVILGATDKLLDKGVVKLLLAVTLVLLALVSFNKTIFAITFLHY